jgi:hypothetical protein
MVTAKSMSSKLTFIDTTIVVLKDTLIQKIRECS